MAAVIQPIPPSDQTSLMFGNLRGIGLTIMFTDDRPACANAAAISTMGTASLENPTCGSAPPMCMQTGRSASWHTRTAGPRSRCGSREAMFGGILHQAQRLGALVEQRPILGCEPSRSQTGQITIGTYSPAGRRAPLVEHKSFQALTQAAAERLVLEMVPNMRPAKPRQRREADAARTTPVERRSFARAVGVVAPGIMSAKRVGSRSHCSRGFPATALRPMVAPGRPPDCQYSGARPPRPRRGPALTICGANADDPDVGRLHDVVIDAEKLEHPWLPFLRGRGCQMTLRSARASSSSADTPRSPSTSRVCSPSNGAGRHTE